VAVQHDGRLITVFSASNYCGRIGNTGGTMLLTPNLDYQLMEHWSPSLSELLSIEAEERAADTSGEAPPQPAAPKQLRRQFSADAEVLMQADVLEKCKDLIAGHKQLLLEDFKGVDVHSTGSVSTAAWAETLSRVIQGAVPWVDYLPHLATVEDDGSVIYKDFLSRYRVTSSASGWQSRMLASMYESISYLNLQQTLEMFDPNKDGMVSFDELRSVLSKYSFGLGDEAVDGLTRELLGGKEQVNTAELMELLNVQYREGDDGRQPPAWAAPLLEAVAKQCAMRQADSIELFQTFDGDGDGFISAVEFQAAMLKLSGHDGAGGTAEQQERVRTMLLDLAAWVDSDGDGKINYLEFISAFRIGPSNGPFAKQEKEGGSVEDLLEHLCALFYRHRWSLKHAFEYFDANSDGVLTPEEFATALRALSTMDFDEEGEGKTPKYKGALSLTSEQTERLVASLDRNADGVIDYDEFLTALQARDVSEV